MNNRQDNHDYRELIKRREEKRKQLSKNKNPFILSLPTTNEDVYKQLYKFDATTELDEYRFQQDLKASGMSQKKQTIQEEEEMPAEDEIGEDEAPEVNYTRLLKGMFKQGGKKPVNKIQNAMFVDQAVSEILHTIKTGEDGISFFAKYGNTTPIKFINCIRNDTHPTEIFKPYDLKVIHTSENQKELTLNDYYTISAHGIVHVYTDKAKKKMEGDTSTEVISLSDWMHESTMFNIITNIQFFKNYAITKIFNIWKANVRYNIYCKTRHKLVHECFIAKPAFANHLMDVNQMMYELQLAKTLSNSIQVNKTWEIEDFKGDQKKARADATRHYDLVVDRVINKIDQVCKEVVDRTNQNNTQDSEEARFGQQVKQKPMNEVRKEAEENAYLLGLAAKDKGRLKSFIRLIDYMSIETLIQTNFVSMNMLLDEMKKEGRKQGIFNSTVNFDVQMFTPDEREISEMLVTLLDDMIIVMRNTVRVITHPSLEQHVKSINAMETISDVQKIIISSVEFTHIKKEMLDKVGTDFQAAETYVNENYEKCRPIYDFINTWNQSEFEKEEHPLDEIKQRIMELKKWLDDINRYIKDIPRGILNVDGKKIKSKLQSIQLKLDSFKDYLYNLMCKKATASLNQLQHYTGSLSKNPQTLKEYAEFIEAHQEADASQKTLEMAKIDIEAMHSLLRRFETNPLKNNDIVMLDDIQAEFVKLLQKLKDAEELRKERRNEMIQKLETDINALIKSVTNTTAQINTGKLIQEDTPPNEALQALNEVKIRNLDKYKERDRNYTNYGKLMGLTQTVNRDLQECEARFNDRKMLWTHVERFNRLSEDWFKNNFTTLNVEEIEKEMKTFENGILKLRQNINNLNKEGKDKVLDAHAARVSHVSTMMPVIQALGNKDLRQRHWKRIFEILGSSWQPGKTFTLSELIQDGVLEKKDQMEEISGRASGEAGIESQVDEIKKKWSELAFTVSNYREQKDKFIIGGVDDIIAALDDHQLKVQTMLGTRFVAEIRPQVEQWERMLVLISDIIDEWLTCQRQWMYLENIFNADDIQKQLPQETAKFFQVDKFWKDQMMKTHKRPLVQDCCSSEELLKKFQTYNKVLEDIQKCLENYLETKRAAFPRFYFLSNDELLEILSQTRNPHAVQQHLRKCFDNINRIKFTEVEESREIVAMQSAEPETQPEVIPFSQSVVSEGPVEHWLLKIQNMMVRSLYDTSKKAYHNYPSNGIERDDWLFIYFAQPVLTIDLVKWTEGCTQAISAMGEGRSTALMEFFDFMKELINKEVSIVRGQLDTLQRTLMGALIVLDVHARDVVGQMVDLNISNLNDFDWAKQLRYYWDADVDNCVVRQTNTRFMYGYEYLGNGPRLVITPLTDKCYMTLTGALHLNFGGAPAGPAGTGKTETTKDLAKALAVQCVVFNCSDGLDYKTMGRFFSGLAQCGAWACFDEFNRIDIEVLSVIAQQILTIQQAIRQKLDQFDFEGRIIPLNIRFGVFITMNPGYAGRTELPDNLKALFRPVAMMIPDYGLIAEIILFSEGFESGRNLARKMVNLYKLSSEQLSKQDHYDFGMRAVKSVLVMAGSLRRKNPDLPEDVVLIRAMRDSNVPKFLEHDLPLFRGIIQDLFPGVIIKDVDYGGLQRSIEEQLELAHHSKTPKFLTKIIQLMETIMVRHGVMVVGLTGTGKTTVIHTLARAVEQLYREGSTDYYHKPVQKQTLNPKSVTMNELFGYTNVLTNEWTDGIVASIVRTAVTDSSDNKKWIIFDGPVDALWIENMNTVLDDNKMLCLNNGQRIKLPQTFTMMFEVQDLAVASPATVSRCGMVYMEPQHLGWEPLLDTWGYHMRESYKVDEKVPTFVNTLIEKVRSFFKENLQLIRDDFREVIPTTDNNLLKSCLNLCQIMLKECREQVTFEKLSQYEVDNYISMVLIFSFVWSAGANLHDSSRGKFSQYIKGKILKHFSGFPFEGEVYDYFCEFQRKEFRPWIELVTEFKYSRSISYFNILVPTADTVKFKYLLDKLIGGGFNVLITGETGTGKSVIIQEFLLSLNAEQFVHSSLNFSAQTSSKNLQDLFLDKDKFARKKKDLLGPPAGRKMCLFIDDVNMPALETYGAQPPNELFRQIIDQGGFYDLKKLYLVYVKDVQFITACAPPGGGRNPVTPRLFRHFNQIWCPDLSQRSMETIFTAILKGFLLEQNKGLDKFAPYIVKSSVEMYFKITKELLPTPTKSHYTFNLRDLSKVFQGILEIRYENLGTKELLVQLWTHESMRVFHDRLVDDKDREWYLTAIQDHCQRVFEFEWERETIRDLLFGDYANPNKEYVRIDNQNELARKFNEYLNMYNLNYPKTMNLVFFSDAIMHLSRLCRILRQNRGNALLVGVGGSGRQSLTRLAAFTRGYNVMSIEITKNYKDASWKDDLKRLLKTAGAKNTEVVFLFSDTQIVRESFLEDINNILNTGEVPNLWAPEDMDEIITDLRPLAKEAGLYDTRDVLLKHFVYLVRSNLHIVLAFSPVGEKLRNRCRQFPSIINCCTIDWFDRWPNEALQSVALKEFGAQEHLGIGAYVQKLSEVSVNVHSDVKDFSDNFYDELRRRNYVTPTSYLELLKLYIDMMKTQQNILPMKIRKYTVGLQTLKETNEEVEKLQKKIIEFQPILEQSARENEQMMIDLEGKTKVANETEAICSKDTAEAQKTRDEVNEMRDSCQQELDLALPILEAAKDAVKRIDKNMINEMKSFKAPPTLVGIVMNAVCLLFGEKEDWDSAKKVLGRMTFLSDLLDFNTDNVPDRRLAKLKQTYLSNPDFTKEKVAAVSQAATCLLTWVIATEKFAMVKKIVGPKEKALKEAEAKLREVETQLAVKQSALKEVQDMVSDLKRNLDNSIRRSEILRQQQETAKVQLVRAEKLVGGLATEADRWKINAAKLEEDLKNLTGNIVLTAASIAYLGPFTYNYRQEMLKKWVGKCKELEIPVADDFSLQRILAEEVQIREWQEAGLPADNLSIDNGIFVFNCRRWPLIIDPQGQANKWIKSLGKEINLQVTKLSEANFLKTLENSIRFGQPVLLENIEEELDPSLEPILLKQTVKKGALLTLRLGDQDVPYNQDFKLYFTTKMPNPHYIPEISIKTTIINFTVTPSGLEDQLLVEVVRQERIDLEEKRVSLILQISQDKRQLQELEDKILKLIAEAQGRILEEEDLITTLDASKITSDTVNQRMALSKITAEEIDQARELYRVVAKRGSVIYFVIADLALIDPMYQYSLEFFIRLFKKRLESVPSPAGQELDDRLRSIIEDITRSFYINICRGLFEKDKLLFSFLIASKIQINQGYIQNREWNIFLRGVLGESNNQDQPEFLAEKVWRNCQLLSRASLNFSPFAQSLKDYAEQVVWRDVMDANDPWVIELPMSIKGSLDTFQKLLLLKTLREEKLIFLIKNYVKETLGPLFIESPVFDLKGSYQDSLCTTPIIFVLSPGADPITYLLNLAKESEIDSTKLKIISLGQGQGEIAKDLIKSGRRTGDWVCLQNCHLAISWLSELERIQELQVEADIDPNYRLWLTSMPTNRFPVPVLQSGIKLTNEPPKGLKANLNRTFNDIKEQDFESCTKQFEYKRLLFSLAFFHAVILERRKFGAIGWNIPYEWMNSDLETCMLQLKMYLDEQAEVPYQTLNYIISEINYGGRVTDDKDVRLITALLRQYFNPSIINDEDYTFSSSGVYHAPKGSKLGDVVQYIQNLPLEDDPEVFGLHINANITFQQKTVSEFMTTLLSVQPRMVADKGTEETPDKIALRLAKDIESRIPGLLVLKKEENPTSLQVFRAQEIDRFNKLVKVMKNTLGLLQKAIQGLVVMSIDLESMFNSFLNSKVPENWEKVAYPSLKPLASWVIDLIQRLTFFKKWVEEGDMKSYWLSAMFFPQGFMTSVMQTYARRTQIPIDTLTFRTEVRPFFKDNVVDVPEDGVNIDGLFIEGCRWDLDTMRLQESQPLVLFSEMPVIWYSKTCNPQAPTDAHQHSQPIEHALQVSTLQNLNKKGYLIYNRSFDKLRAVP